MNKYKKNDIISVKVTSIESYGAFVKVDKDYTGLIHISEINGKYIKNINKYIKLNSIIKAKILNIDDEKKQLQLTLKIQTEKNIKKNILNEVGSGFSFLQKKLPKWVEDAKKEIEREKK